MKILDSYKKIAQSLMIEADIDDEKMIKYKDKDGESKEMKAGSAKTMPDDHPAKQVWQKMSDADKGGDDSEKDDDKIGGDDFERSMDPTPGTDDDKVNDVGDENDDIIRSLEDMDLNGLDVNSVDSEADDTMYAELMGKDVDEPDNAMIVNAYQDGGEIGYAISIGSGHDVIYFDSKEEMLDAAKKLANDATIKDAMDGESDPPGVTLADLGDHAKNVLKSDDDESKPIPAAPMETKVINGVKYRAIKESKKPKKHILKENYERFFGSINEMTKYDREKVDQQEVMEKKLKSKKVDGYSFSIDQNSGGWEWNGPNGYFYATPWDTLMVNSMGSSAGNPNIVKVEAFDNDNEEIMDTEMRYVHSGNMSKDLNAYLKIVKTIILKSKLK